MKQRMIGKGGTFYLRGGEEDAGLAREGSSFKRERGRCWIGHGVEYGISE